MPYLLIHNLNGNEFVSLVRDKHREPTLGEHEYIEITEEQFEKSLSEITAWYREKTKAGADGGPHRGKSIKMKRGDLLARLADIIRQSHHEGERENARALYLKYAGRPFEG